MHHRVALITTLMLPLSLMSAPAIAQGPTPSPTPASASTTPPGAASDPTLKSAWDKAVKSGKPVEVPSRSTETMKVWADPDGKNLRAELHTRPVQLKNPDSGVWEPIDTRIVTRDGKLQAARVKTPLTFGGRGTKHLVSATGEEGKSGLGVSRALPEPKISENTITYPDAVAPGADLVVLALADGFVSQVVFRHKPTGPVTVRLPLTLPKDTKFGKNAEGQPQLQDAEGQPKAAPIVLTAMDAKVENSPEKGKSFPVTASVEPSGKTHELVFTPDATFLADPAVTYPVTIAAASEWFGGGVPTDAWVNKNSPSANNASAGYLRVGTTQTSADIARVYLKFNTTVPELEGARVIDADLYVWNYKSGGPNNQLCGEIRSGIVASRVTSPWTLDGTSTNLSWNNQPSNNGAEGGSGNEYGYSIDPNATGWCAKEEALVHRISGMARAWIEEGVPNHGLLLRAVTESPAINWRQYYASEYGGSPYPGFRHPPTLMVEYEPATVERSVLHWTESGAPRRSKPTPEEALALARQADSSVIDLGPMSDALAERLESNAATPYFVGPENLTPLPGEDWTTDVDPEMDEFDPEVSAVSPMEDSTDALPSAKISATFNEAVTDAVIAVKDAQDAVVEGTSIMDAGNKVLTFTPGRPLTPGAKYTALVSGARDGSNNKMDPHPWSFTVSTLAAHWKLDEGTGSTTADSSGNGHNASLNDTAAWIVGKNGNAVSNVPSQARIAASQAAAKQGKAVEVDDETTATSITYAQPDGKSFKTEITAGPVRTRQNDAWVPINTTLAEQGGKLWPKALAEGAAVEISGGGTDPFVKMTADGKSYALTWPIPLPKPTIKDNVATYADAAGVGADLVVTALPTGFRHDVVLHKRPTKPLEIRIGVQADGLTLSEGKDGRLFLTKGKGKKLIASAPQPAMWEASTKASQAKDRLAKGGSPKARHAKVATDVVVKDGRTELVLKPDHAFLTDPATTYPVRVDPTTTLPFNNDVEVADSSDAEWPADPTAWYLTAGRMYGSLSRIYLRFDTAGLAGQTVSDARLSLLNIDAQGCGTAVGPGLQVRRVTAAWDENNLHWSNKPAATTEDAVTNTTAFGQSCTQGVAPLEWNITGIAQDWANGSANHGLMLRHPNEANTADNYRVFPSAEETSDFNRPPTLTITTSGPTSVPQVSGLAITPAQSTGGNTTATSLTPQLTATVSDVIGGNLTGEFEIEHDPATPGQGTGQVWAGASAAVASGSPVTVTVPAGKLTDGWKVRWRARAVNAAASSASAWSDWQQATVDVPNPAVGSFQVTPAQQVDGVTVTTSLTPALHTTITDPAGQPLRAEFELEHDPAVPGQGSGRVWTGAVDNVVSGNQAIVTVPANTLTDGWKVRWRTRAINPATALGSPWSDWQTLIVDVSDPVSEPAVGALQVTPSQQVDGTTVAPTRTPSLLAQVSDPAGGTLRAEVEVEHDPAAPAGQGSGQIWTGSADNVASGTQASLTVPAGKLTDGWKVRWRVRAVSATTASAWSGWQSFTVSLPKPTATGLTITPLKVVDGVAVSTTLTPTLQATVTDPTGQALRAEAEIEHDPAAPAGQGSGQIWTGSADNVVSGTQASLTVPAGKLTDGWKVRWRVRAVTEQASSTWSDWQQVTVDVAQPGEEPLAQTAGPVIRTDQSFTVAAWLRWNDKDGTYSVVEQKGTHQAPFRLGNDPEHGLVFTFTSADSADATVEGVRSGVEPPVGEWFHLAGVYDAATKTATIHLNGTAIGTATLTFPTWDAARLMTVGSAMVGSIDEVRVHLKNLTPAEITALQAPQSTPAPLASPPAKASTLASDDFKYDHMSLEDCERGRDQRTGGSDIWNGGEGWDSIAPYSGCWSRHLSFAIYERSTKYNKHCKCMLTTTGVEDYLNFDMTVVMHSYLGSADGLSVIGGAGTSLSPRDIKVWTRVDNFWTADDDFWNMLLGLGGTDPDDLYQSFKLQVDVVGGTNDCVKVFSSGDNGGLTRTGNVKKWMDDGDDVFIFHSTFGTGRASRCSIRPWMVYNDPVHAGNWDKIAVSAWGKPENDKSAGAPTVRCDSLSMGAKTATYRGGCVFYGSSRVYEMSRLDLDNGAVARHIELAYTRPQDTVPFKTDGPKHFPGKWPSGEALSRITSKDPRYTANQDAKDEVCDEFFDDRPRKLTGEKNKTKWEQCDEFPFASTKQGAAFVHDRYGAKNFSVKSILGSQNTSAGRHLNIFYARYRVLANDKFWVHIK
ncbi:DNRLRE domain-containing protein [Streptosporangium sp. NPDC004379]|uniref:DNRLRE domain-containing protein n=1 Tax=Streptosporangium sp. NPDC004379 TaxID=3366189 RepID=UPI0036C7483E